MSEKEFFLALWPDGSIMIARASERDELFALLDEFDAPEFAKVYELPWDWNSLRMVLINGESIVDGACTRDGGFTEISKMPEIKFTK